MKLAFSTLGCPDWSFERAMAEAKRMGYGAIEVRGFERCLRLGEVPVLKPENRKETLRKLEEAGLKVSGVSPDGKLVEIVELPQAKHPYFIACQFHPEFKSRPTAPHPLFLGLVAAALKGKSK